MFTLKQFSDCPSSQPSAETADWTTLPFAMTESGKDVCKFRLAESRRAVGHPAAAGKSFS